MKRFCQVLALLLAVTLMLSACGTAASAGSTAAAAQSTDTAQPEPTVKTVALDPDHPTTVTIWHYYNGAQQAAFTEAVAQFNATVGAEQGIYAEEHSIGAVDDLDNAVLASARKDVGSDALPNIFSGYADISYEVDKLGMLADLTPYFTQEERDSYIGGFLDEGYISGDNSLKIIPTAKSTEILMVNKTDWDTFAAATGAKMSDLSTLEGVTKTAKDYYDWTDAQTPDVPNDGKAFFGRDAFANYMLIGARQLGTEIFRVENGACKLDFNKETVRRLWDNYYVPMVAGWFAESARFRSDDVKMGSIIACVGSTSSASYFPTSVLVSDTESYDIEMAVQQAPEFADGEAYAVQQGAGMAVTKGTDEQVYASVVFLKWFTSPTQNAGFAALSGYMPVTKEANTLDYLEGVMNDNDVSDNTRAVIEASVATTANNEMYTPHAFEKASDARAVLNDAMPAKAAADRAAFVKLLDGGTSYEDALAQFDTDENFDAWYEETKSQLEALTSAG